MSQENLSPVRVANPLWRAWWVMLLLGVVATVFGIVAIVWPVQAAAALMRAIGVIAIAEGVVALFGLLGRQLLVPRSWLVFHGVVSILFGVLAAVFPLQTAGVLVLLLALWLLLGGIFRIAFGIRVRGYVNRAWLIILSGVLSVALGVLFVVSPTSGVAATTLWLGIFAVVYGVFQILVAIYLMRVSR